MISQDQSRFTNFANVRVSSSSIRAALQGRNRLKIPPGRVIAPSPSMSGRSDPKSIIRRAKAVGLKLELGLSLENAIVVDRPD